MIGTVITTKGRALIAKMMATETAIAFTRAAVGTGSVPAGDDPAGLAGLNQYRMDGKITAVSSGNEAAYITFQIASRDVEAGFVVTEAGLFASDPDEGEILYAYLDMSDDPQYIYKNGGEVNKVAEITLGVIVGQIEKITAVIAPDGLVTREQLEQALDGKVSKEEDKGLSSNDFTDAYRDKLQGIEEGANNYVHPATHAAGMIVQDASRRFVSDAEKAAWNGIYQQSAGYTDQRIAGLINGAPATLDTLGEIAKAMQDNENVVEALDAAVGKKANAAELDSHVGNTTKHITAQERTAWNGKLNPGGNGSDLTVNFSQAATRANIGTGESLKTVAGKIMKWFADLANGAASSLLGANLTANRALVANGSGKVAVSEITATELGYLDNAKSNIQGQIDVLNTGLTNLIRQAATASSGFPNALAAGESGLITLSINIPDARYIISIRPHTASITDLKGLQMTPAYINPTKDLVITYFAPKAVSMDMETLEKIRWMITWVSRDL